MPPISLSVDVSITSVVIEYRTEGEEEPSTAGEPIGLLLLLTHSS